MAGLEFLVWNVHWMNDLFGPNDEPPAFLPADHKPYHTPESTVRQRRDDLAAVLNDVAPDVAILLEGPERTSELQLFFDQDVDGDWEVQVQHSHRQLQTIALAVRTDRGKFRTPSFHYYDTTNIAAFDPFEVDTDDEEIEVVYRFDRRPLYAEIRPEEGRNVRILGLHLKSKALYGAYEWSRWWQRAGTNRRKILAQATQLRLEFLDPFLEDEVTQRTPLIVCGGINDGPGLDAGEKRLFGSAVERLMGLVWRPELCLGNALFDGLDRDEQASLDFTPISTAGFHDPIFRDMWHHVWTDHILYSRNADAPWVEDGRVYRYKSDGTPFWEAYPHASDHLPIVATITPPPEE